MVRKVAPGKKHLIIYLTTGLHFTFISLAENQKGVITIQQCSVEPEGHYLH